MSTRPMTQPEWSPCGSIKITLIIRFSKVFYPCRLGPSVQIPRIRVFCFGRGPFRGVQDRRAGGARRRQGGQRHHGRAGAARQGLSGVGQGRAPNSRPQVGKRGRKEFVDQINIVLHLNVDIGCVISPGCGFTQPSPQSFAEYYRVTHQVVPKLSIQERHGCYIGPEYKTWEQPDVSPCINHARAPSVDTRSMVYKKHL